MRVAVIAAVHKRPEITLAFARMWLRYAEKIKDEHQLYLILIGSKKDRDSLDGNYFKFLIQPNEPLSNKVQYGLFYARASAMNAVIRIGSDDFPDFDLVRAALKKVSDGACEALGVRDLYMHEASEGKTYYWGGYAKVKPHGAMRVFSSKALDKLGWMLYPETTDTKLDATSDDVLAKNKVAMRPFFQHEFPGKLVTFKRGDDCINPTSVFKSRYRLREVPLREVYEAIPSELLR